MYLADRPNHQITVLLTSPYEDDVSDGLKTLWFDNLDAIRAETDGASYERLIAWLIERTGSYTVAYQFQQRCFRWLPTAVQRTITNSPEAQSLYAKAQGEFALLPRPLDSER
jgi:hypothetical protein